MFSFNYQLHVDSVLKLLKIGYRHFKTFTVKLFVGKDLNSTGKTAATEIGSLLIESEVQLNPVDSLHIVPWNYLVLSEIRS